MSVVMSTIAIAFKTYEEAVHLKESPSQTSLVTGTGARVFCERTSSVIIHSHATSMGKPTTAPEEPKGTATMACAAARRERKLLVICMVVDVDVQGVVVAQEMSAVCRQREALFYTISYPC